jgi:hypothetical protein
VRKGIRKYSSGPIFANSKECEPGLSTSHFPNIFAIYAVTELRFELINGMLVTKVSSR